MTRPRWGDLGGLFEPEVVTVIGASENSQAVRWLVRNLDGSRVARVNLVNARRAEVFGRKCYQSARDIEGLVGLVYLFVPLEQTLPVLDELPCEPTGVA